jgi:hypothetical protein
MLKALDDSIAPTVMEDRLLEELDVNWFETFKTEHPDNEIVRMFGYSILGAAPFYEHLDMLIHGKMVKTIGAFVGGILFEFAVRPELLTLAAMLGLIYVLLWTYLSGGFIGMYARDYRSSFTEFLELGARYFGKFFRLVLIQCSTRPLLAPDWVCDIPARPRRTERRNRRSFAMLRNSSCSSSDSSRLLVRKSDGRRVQGECTCCHGRRRRFGLTHPVRTVLSRCRCSPWAA